MELIDDVRPEVRLLDRIVPVECVAHDACIFSIKIIN